MLHNYFPRAKVLSNPYTLITILAIQNYKYPWPVNFSHAMAMQVHVSTHPGNAFRLIVHLHLPRTLGLYQMPL